MWLVCFVPFCFSAPVFGQKTVDQIIALVNDEMIARSDLLWTLALDPKSPSPGEGVSSDLLRQTLEVMIDQRLIAQEARRVPASDVTEQDISKYLDQLISRFRSPQEFRDRVGAVGLSEERVKVIMRERILIERFVDFRFRSFVFVTDTEVQRYYDDTFAPKVRARGQVPPALDAKLPKGNVGEKEMTVGDTIAEIIRQTKIDQEIDRFLNSVRQRADVTILAEL
jgi:hypothetical protein